MKAAFLVLAVAMATLETATPPQTGVREQSPQSAPPVPLTAGQCKCSIDVVVKRPGGEPIPNVNITVIANPALRIETGADGQRQTIQTPPALATPLMATTDANGHAAFRDLPEANYSVRAERSGFMGTQSTGTAAGNPVTATVFVGPAIANAEVAANAIVLNPSEWTGAASDNGSSLVRQPNPQIRIPMIQGATISGRLLDSNQRPLSGVPVGAFRVTYNGGQRTLNPAGTAVLTDDRGEFRLFWFLPGEYYIRTGAVRPGTANFPTHAYYPGSLDPTRATTVALSEGQEFSGASFSIPATTGVTVSGTIVNNVAGGRIGPDGQPNRTVPSAFLAPRNTSFFDIPILLQNINRGGRVANTDGRTSAFELRGVPPGTYDIYPLFSESGTATTSRYTYYTGRTPIEVGSENVTDITAVVNPGVELKGHVTITGTQPPAVQAQPLTTANINFQIRPLDNLPSEFKLTNHLSLDKEGAFTLSNVTEARYMIADLYGLPADAYVAEIRMGSQSIYDNGVIPIGTGAPEPLEILISRGGGTIQGMVEDAQHKPVPSMQVALIPDSPRRRNFLLYKRAQSNAMGSFTMSGLAPGAYKIFAWESLPSGAEQNEEYMRKYDALGAAVNVVAGLPLASIQVPIIPAKH